MTPPTLAAGLCELADRYAGFIIDQWGVLHDGTSAYPDAFATLAELARRAKRIVLLTNSSRRVADNAAQLRGLGFNPGMFEGIVTSGEATWRGLRDRSYPPFDRLGRRCLLVGPKDDTALVDGIDLDLVEDAAEADFVLLSWLDHDLHTDAWFETLLPQALAHRLPLVCANPDRIVRVAGGLIAAPGRYAARYEEMGGEVVYVGKPHRPIYAACLDHLEGLEPADILCIGDSLEHDIAGANGMGLDAALIAGGIHAEELLAGDGKHFEAAALEALMAEHGARPRFVLRRFSW